MVEMYSVYPNKSLESKIKGAFSNTDSFSLMNFVRNLHNEFQPTLLLQSYQFNQLLLYIEITAFIYSRAGVPNLFSHKGQIVSTIMLGWPKNVPGCLNANVVSVLNGGLSKLTSCLNLNRLPLQSGLTQTTVNFNIIFIYLDI